MHKEHLEQIYHGKKKSVHWLMGEHNRLFADWFEKKVCFLSHLNFFYSTLMPILLRN